MHFYQIKLKNVPILLKPPITNIGQPISQMAHIKSRKLRFWIDGTAASIDLLLWKCILMINFVDSSQLIPMKLYGIRSSVIRMVKVLKGIILQLRIMRISHLLCVVSRLLEWKVLQLLLKSTLIMRIGKKGLPMFQHSNTNSATILPLI